MYKLVVLLLKYVKLAILNELLVECRSQLKQFENQISSDNTDMHNNFLAGNIRAYAHMSRLISERIGEIKHHEVQNSELL